jgi:hypothetical protein
VKTMRKFLALYLIVCALIGAACPSSAQMMMMGAGVPPKAPAVTFDPSNTAPNIALSGGNLTGAATASNLNGQTTRSTTSHSSGKFYVEFTGTLINATHPGTSGFGFANASMADNNDFPGSNNNNGIEIYDNGEVFLNGTNTATYSSASTGNIISMAVDFGGQLIWWSVNGGNWNAGGTANPATGIGGVSFSTINAGPYFAVSELDAHTGGASSTTINFGATTYSYTPPSGFGNW